MQKQPWHSTKSGQDVYHDNDKCTEGNNIESYYWAAGTGGRRKCAHCARLDAEGK